MDWVALEDSGTATLPEATGRAWRPFALAVERAGYHHTGICLGDGTVVHFWGEGRKSVVMRTSIGEFVGSSPRVWRLSPSGDVLAAGLTALLALSSLGRGGFSILHCNCEHFTYFCLTGRHSSPQAERLLRQPFRHSVSSALSGISYIVRRLMRTPADLEPGVGTPLADAVAAPRYALGRLWLDAASVAYVQVPLFAPPAAAADSSGCAAASAWCRGIPDANAIWHHSQPTPALTDAGCVWFDQRLRFFAGDTRLAAPPGVAARVAATDPMDWLPPFLRRGIAGGNRTVRGRRT